VEKATTVSTMKRKKKELAILHEELAILKREEEAVKVPVARLHELLNAQLDSETMKTVDEESKFSKFDANRLFCRVTPCNANVDTIYSQATSKTDDDDEEERVKNHTFDHILDVICG
jgi:hypothetical protein